MKDKKRIKRLERKIEKAIEEEFGQENKKED